MRQGTIVLLFELTQVKARRVYLVIFGECLI
jgi:hypothetical protein